MVMTAASIARMLRRTPGAVVVEHEDDEESTYGHFDEAVAEIDEGSNVAVQSNRASVVIAKGALSAFPSYRVGVGETITVKQIIAGVVEDEGEDYVVNEIANNGPDGMELRLFLMGPV